MIKKGRRTIIWRSNISYSIRKYNKIQDGAAQDKATQCNTMQQQPNAHFAYFDSRTYAQHLIGWLMHLLHIGPIMCCLHDLHVQRLPCCVSKVHSQPDPPLSVPSPCLIYCNYLHVLCMSHLGSAGSFVPSCVCQGLS